MTKKVILAEDNPDIREMLVSRISQYQGVEVESVGDGIPLVERVRNGTYSLVLTDNQMPQMGGLRSIVEIRKYNTEIPIYMMSGSPVKEEALQAGATGFIPKGLNFMEELEPVLKQYFG